MKSLFGFVKGRWKFVTMRTRSRIKTALCVLFGGGALVAADALVDYPPARIVFWSLVVIAGLLAYLVRSRKLPAHMRLRLLSDTWTIGDKVQVSNEVEFVVRTGVAVLYQDAVGPVFHKLLLARDLYQAALLTDLNDLKAMNNPTKWVEVILQIRELQAEKKRLADALEERTREREGARSDVPPLQAKIKQLEEDLLNARANVHKQLVTDLGNTQAQIKQEAVSLRDQAKAANDASTKTLHVAEAALQTTSTLLERIPLVKQIVEMLGLLLDAAGFLHCQICGLAAGKLTRLYDETWAGPGATPQQKAVKNPYCCDPCLGIHKANTAPTGKKPARTP